MTSSTHDDSALDCPPRGGRINNRRWIALGLAIAADASLFAFKGERGEEAHPFSLELVAVPGAENARLDCPEIRYHFGGELGPLHPTAATAAAGFAQDSRWSFDSIGDAGGGDHERLFNVKLGGSTVAEIRVVDADFDETSPEPPAEHGAGWRVRGWRRCVEPAPPTSIGQPLGR